MSNGTDAGAKPDDIDAEVASEEESVDAIVQGADEEIERQNSADRSKIANVIVGAFVVAIGLLFVFVIGGVWFTTGCSAEIAKCGWGGAAEFMLKALTTVLLPVVTLVLGYYFGTAKK